MTLMKKNSNVIEVALIPKPEHEGALEVLKSVLELLGVSPDRIIEQKRNEQRLITVYFFKSKEAENFRKNVRKAGLKNIRIQFKKLAPKDWQGRWKLNLHPFQLTKRFDVVPLWRKKEYYPTKREPIFLDTIMAFGTGQHETTRFMTQIIERCEGRFGTFFDAGTGTGILSIVALKCGARRVWAIDIDGESVNVAQKNLLVNGLKFDRIEAKDLKKLRTQKQFDFVAANLITDKLIQMQERLISLVKPSGYLAVSGIAVENLNRLRREYKKLPLRCIKVEKGKDWTAILYKKL